MSIRHGCDAAGCTVVARDRAGWFRILVLVADGSGMDAVEACSVECGRKLVKGFEAASDVLKEAH